MHTNVNWSHIWVELYWRRRWDVGLCIVLSEYLNCGFMHEPYMGLCIILLFYMDSPKSVHEISYLVFISWKLEHTWLSFWNVSTCLLAWIMLFVMVLWLVMGLCQVMGLFMLCCLKIKDDLSALSTRASTLEFTTHAQKSLCKWMEYPVAPVRSSLYSSRPLITSLPIVHSKRDGQS